MGEALRSALEERVAAAVREGEEELVGLVSELVTFDTTTLSSESWVIESSFVKVLPAPSCAVTVNLFTLLRLSGTLGKAKRPSGPGMIGPRDSGPVRVTVVVGVAAAGCASPTAAVTSAATSSACRASSRRRVLMA